MSFLRASQVAGKCDALSAAHAQGDDPSHRALIWINALHYAGYGISD